MLSFFFSSRRGHTRYWRDWSSDVCSSDLQYFRRLRSFESDVTTQPWFLNCAIALETPKTPEVLMASILRIEQGMGRSEERRVVRESSYQICWGTEDKKRAEMR